MARTITTTTRELEALQDAAHELLDMEPPVKTMKPAEIVEAMAKDIKALLNKGWLAEDIYTQLRVEEILGISFSSFTTYLRKPLAPSPEEKKKLNEEREARKKAREERKEAKEKAKDEKKATEKDDATTAVKAEVKE